MYESSTRCMYSNIFISLHYNKKREQCMYTQTCKSSRAKFVDAHAEQAKYRCGNASCTLKATSLCGKVFRSKNGSLPLSVFRFFINVSSQNSEK